MPTIAELAEQESVSDEQLEDYAIEKYNEARANNGERIGPQEGPQTTFLESTADIAIYGGSAGGGKSWGMLLDPLRHIDVMDFRAVIFRRTYPQIKNPGGLWDESKKLYKSAGGVPKQTTLEWMFGDRSVIAFKHIQYEVSKEEYQGAQIAYIGFDELTHFTRTMFFYMLSRNRSTCGVKPVIRATCNPDPNSWVKQFIAPWIDKKYIQPDEMQPRRLASGVLGYFTQVEDVLIWHSKKAYDHEVATKIPIDRTMKTVTFIRSSIYDNKKLLATNPQYLSSLKALPMVDQERLLYGNWDVNEAGNMFRKEWFGELYRKERVPKRFRRIIRFWDTAGTKPSEVEKWKSNPDYTCGVLLGVDLTGKYWILDVEYIRDTPQKVILRMQETALRDYEEYDGHVETASEQEPGGSGIFQVDYIKTSLKGYSYRGFKSTGTKIGRATPVSAEIQRGNMVCVEGEWNDWFFGLVTAFPNPDVHDDPVDALSGGYNMHEEPVEEFIYRPKACGVTGWR